MARYDRMVLFEVVARCLIMVLFYLVARGSLTQYGSLELNGSLPV
jgi:hypothetical protein